MEQVAYIVKSKRDKYTGFIALLTPDADDSALFVTNNTKPSESLETIQEELKKLPAGIKTFLKPINSSEDGLSWLSELEAANKK